MYTYTTFLALCFAITILFVPNIISRICQNYFHQFHTPQTCLDDLTVVPPYIIPQGQSILDYNPTVIIKKNQPYSSCTWVPEGFTSIPSRDCPLDSQYVLTPTIPMEFSSILTNTMCAAQKFLNDSSSNTSIIYTQSISTIHCSLDYFSCYNEWQYSTIQDIFSHFKWNSFLITFNEIACDVTTVGSYIVVEADYFSQEKLFHFVKRLEGEIEKQGIDIKTPRIEAFHMTLAGVRYTYPSDCIVEKLREELLPQLPNQKFGTVRVCCFITKIGIEITYYYAQDCNPKENCVVDVDT